jgi:hypothetical protein
MSRFTVFLVWSFGIVSWALWTYLFVYIPVWLLHQWLPWWGMGLMVIVWLLGSTLILKVLLAQTKRNRP